MGGELGGSPRAAALSRVYPRMGGETWRNPERQQVAVGLSPRGRGTPDAAARRTERENPASPAICVRLKNFVGMEPHRRDLVFGHGPVEVGRLPVPGTNRRAYSL